MRRTTAFTLHRYRLDIPSQQTGDLLTFTAGTDRYHRRLEQLLVDTYCRQLGVAGHDHTSARQRRTAPPSGLGRLGIAIPPAAGMAFEDAHRSGAWVSWIITLVVAEILIRRNRAQALRAR